MSAGKKTVILQRVPPLHPFLGKQVVLEEKTFFLFLLLLENDKLTEGEKNTVQLQAVAESATCLFYTLKVRSSQ